MEIIRTSNDTINSVSEKTTVYSQMKVRSF